MNLLKFIPIKLTLCLILGIVLGNYFNVGILFSLVFLLLSFSVTTIAFLQGKNKKPTGFGVLVGLTTIGIGCFSLTLRQPENQWLHYTRQNFEKHTIWHLKIHEVMKPTSFSKRYIAWVKRIENQKAEGKILLNFPNDSTHQNLSVDDEIITRGALAAVKGPLNPHQFDYQQYLKGLGITHQMRLKAHDYVKKDNASTTIYGITASFRNRIISTLKDKNFGEEERSIIQALLLGQRHDISANTYSNYKNAGAVHILAVSGLHIGILLMLLEFLLSPLAYLPKGKTLKLMVIVAILWGFALVAGLSASIVRAVTMFSFVAYALYLNRPSNTFNILALSLFFILLVFNPMLLFQVGFQMSYAAVFAIVWIYPLLQKIWFPKNPVIRKIWQLFCVSIAAQLGVLPISLFYFHQFPALFFISNLLVVPFLGLILGMGILVMLLALLKALPDFLVYAYNYLIGLMNNVIGWVAQQEAFVFKNIPFDSVQLLISYGIIIYLILVLTKVTFKRTAILMVCVISFQLWSFYLAYKGQRQEGMIILHQHRNSVLFHQNGEHLQVLTSNRKKVQRMITDYSVAKRIQTIEQLPLQNTYNVNGENFYIMDSSGVFPPKKYRTDYLLLTDSPRINFERLLDSTQPSLIIADGSNYKSDIARWRATCTKRKFPFYYTGDNGAYYFK